MRHNRNTQSLKMRLGSKTIDPTRVSSIKRAGSKVCVVKFVTGESISVMCGVKAPDPMRISFPGTPEELKALLLVYIQANRRGHFFEE